MPKEIIKKLSFASFLLILMFSCKDQVKTQTKSEIEIKINVLSARNSTKIVEGSTLCIYETGEDIPCIPPILLEGKTVVVTLKKK